MSGQNEEVSKLKNEIIKCQEETLQLFYEKQRWPDKCYVLEQTKQKAVADLRKQLSSKSTQTSHLEDLNSALKAEDKLHTLLNGTLTDIQIEYDEYKKSNAMHLIDVAQRLDEGKKRLSDQESEINRLCEIRVMMEKTLENLNAFCEAVYSTLDSKESSGVSFVKEDKKPQKRLDPKKSQ
ncbi:hypothetical protein ACLB2K_073100 [Fragaria x ananassa]